MFSIFQSHLVSRKAEHQEFSLAVSNLMTDDVCKVQQSSSDALLVVGTWVSNGFPPRNSSEKTPEIVSSHKVVKIFWAKLPNLKPFLKGPG